MPARTPIPTEVEAKLLVPNLATLRALAKLSAVEGYPLERRGAILLHTRYLDTSDLTLARQGIALRVRRNRRAWEATAKWSGDVSGLVHRRPELTVPLSGAPARPFRLPRGPLHTALAALVANHALAPVLITDIERTVLDVWPRAGGAAGEMPLAEIALDRVTLRGPRARQGHTLAYYEVEIEQRTGTLRLIARLAKALAQQFELRPSPGSKFSRGLALLYGASWKADASSIAARRSQACSPIISAKLRE